jgi:hypothetical protein
LVLITSSHMISHVFPFICTQLVWDDMGCVVLNFQVKSSHHDLCCVFLVKSSHYDLCCVFLQVSQKLVLCFFQVGQVLALFTLSKDSPCLVRNKVTSCCINKTRGNDPLWCVLNMYTCHHIT